MPGMRGLTGGIENCRILIGKKPRFDLTMQGKLRVKFDGAFGINDPDNLKFCTWRHCIAYGENAEIMHNAIVGSLVKVIGWITTEAKRDESGKPVIEDGQIVKMETIICGKTEIIQQDNVQKESQLQFGESQDNIDSLVGQTAEKGEKV